MRIKGIIFDLDGTLANTLPLSIHIFQLIFDKYAQKQLTDDQILELFGPNEAGVIKQVISEYEEPYQEYVSLYKQYHDEWVTLVQGIRELLNQLKTEGVKTALVTGKSEPTTRFTLDRLDIEPYFDLLRFGAVEVKSNKVENIADILNQWGILSSEAAYVGDSPSDVKDAKKEAGVLPIAIQWDGSNKYYHDTKPETDLFFKQPEEMTAWLKQRNAPVSAAN